MQNSSLSILLVDDDDAVRMALMEMLTLTGYIVYPAESAAEATEMLRSRKVDLVITDLMMPDTTGLELIDQVSRIYPNLPFIVLSAFGTTERARESLQHGAVDFLSKPVSRSELIIAVERNLERRRLEVAKLREVTAEMSFGVIQALAAAIDLRDPYTASHSQRVAEIAERIANGVGVTQEDFHVLHTACMMHDIGKIGVPDAILRKPGRLEPHEWEEMRQHPLQGSEIIGNHLKGQGQVATLIRHHHENMDGTGYPDGLEGDAIPYLARIISVADAFEALTSNRSYRKSLPREGALEVLLQNAGHRFDPDIVHILIEIENTRQ